MKKDPRVYLAHILECVEQIMEFTGGGRGEFLRGTQIQDAVKAWHSSSGLNHET